MPASPIVPPKIPHVVPPSMLGVKFVLPSGAVARSSVYPKISLAELKALALLVVRVHIPVAAVALAAEDAEGDRVLLESDAEVALVLEAAEASGFPAARFHVELVEMSAYHVDAPTAEKALIKNWPSALRFLVRNVGGGACFAQACATGASRTIFLALLETADLDGVGFPTLPDPSDPYSTKTASLLWIAANAGSETAVRFLYERGATVVSGPKGAVSPLFAAVAREREDLAVLLLERGWSIRSMGLLLHVGIALRQERTVGALLDLGLDVNAPFTLEDKDISPWLSTGWGGSRLRRGEMTPLERAIDANSPALVRLLLDKGAAPGASSPASRMLAPLQRAVASKNVEVVAALIDKGANLNGRWLPFSFGRGGDGGGGAASPSGAQPFTPTVFVFGSHGGTLPPTIEPGSLLSPLSPLSPLLIATTHVESRSEAVAELLIRSGADVNAKDGQGRTALTLLRTEWYGGAQEQHPHHRSPGAKDPVVERLMQLLEANGAKG